MNEVRILESPESGFVVRQRPHILSCKALNANRIRFKCNNQWIDDDRHEVETGVFEGSSYRLVSVEISRSDLDSNEDLDCECFASNDPNDDGIRSESAKIRIAYIRKHFYESPVSERIPEGKTIQLSCVPPDGEPKVETFWHRNGEEIQPSADSNVILANDGSLILSAARLSDSGNYTCEARNIANRRLTDPAELIVFVDGNWSPWAPWSGNCAIDCSLLSAQLDMNRGDEAAISRVLPTERRIRSCNNPAPLNGGAQCLGADDDYRLCSHDCRIDGTWSRWAQWSECNEHCERIRTRQCTAPPSSNGGRFCQGRDSETLNCTENIQCRRAVHSISSPLPNDLLNGGQTYVLASLFCFAFLLIIITLLIAALFVRRRRGSAKEMYFPQGDVRTVLLNQQNAAALLGGTRSDVKMLCTPTPAVPHLSLPNGMNQMNSPLFPNYTIKSTKSFASNYSNRRGWKSEVPRPTSRSALIPNSDHYSSSNNSSGSGVTPNRRPPPPFSVPFCGSPSEDYATLYDIVADKYVTQQSVHSLDRSSQSTIHDPGVTIVAAQVDGDCSRIELRKCGAAVSFSSETFDRQSMVFLSVNDDINDHPQLAMNETSLSSTIEFGRCPNSDVIELRRPVVLSFDHYASIFPKDLWQFIVYADFGLGWSIVTVLGEENLNTPIHVHIEGQKCHLMTDQFGRFLLVGKPKRPNFFPMKRVRLVAYASLPIESQQKCVDIRTYIVPDSVMALENVRKQEEEEGGTVISAAEEFLLSQKGSICLCLDEEMEIRVTEDGYTSPSIGIGYVEIPDSRHLWCSQNGIHCTLRLVVSNGSADRLIKNRLSISQKGSNIEKQYLSLRFNPYEQNSTENCSSSETSEKLVSINFQLNPQTKFQLSRVLDIPNEEERDWRGLARKLGFERYPQFFGMHPGCSPTSLIIDLWEASSAGSERAVLDLIQKLKFLGRPDAVAILERYLAESTILR